MPEALVVHYSEIALKGRNRPEFVRMLRQNVGRALSPMPSAVESRSSRLIVHVEGPAHEAVERISRVFGVSWVARASVVERSFEAIREEVLRRSDALGPARTFMISAKRADKSFPLESLELERRLGAEVVERTGKKVDLSSPDATIFVDVIEGNALVYGEKFRGAGGLPVGAAGRVMHLFSGGIDSPVAAWLLMKRGCKPIHVHFYLAPTAEGVLQSKIPKMMEVLAKYGGRTTLVAVPFAEYQLETFGAPGDSEPSLFRRFMRMTAEALAPRFGAHAVSTGDSLSQAASQTLWNIGVFDHGSSLPVFRPLLTYDKQEITELAERIGTYELSIQEYKDCCAIVTRHPKTKVRLDVIERLSDRLRFASLVQKCLEGATLYTFDPSTGVTRTSPLAAREESLPRPGDSQKY